MRLVDYPTIIKRLGDLMHPVPDSNHRISAPAFNNHVFKVAFGDGGHHLPSCLIFGKYEQFLEDHRIIHVLANNLLYPFENVLAKSLVRDGQIYTYRHKDGL